MGNYDQYMWVWEAYMIIPQREKMGNYDKAVIMIAVAAIIPQREKMGNYDKEKPFRLRL